MKYTLLALSLLFIYSCDTCSTRYKERAEKATRSQGDIIIGIVDSSVPPSFFVEGVKLAIDELNQEGGLLGRRIRPVFYDDERSFQKGQNIAEELSKNTDVIAVVGHLYSDIAISASVTYEENGILFISPGATEQDLTREDSVLTFRNIPSDEETGRETAAFALRSGYLKMSVVYDSESSGKRVAEVFHEHADELGIEIVAEKPFSAWEDDFRLLISDLISEGEFDAVFLGGTHPSAGGNIIRQMRDMGIVVPIIGTTMLDSPELWNIAGKGAQDTIVPTVFDPGQPKPLTRNFVKEFKSHFAFEPDTWSAQGYDAVQVLAFAIEEGGSAVPIVISTTLRFLSNWEGVTGRYSFQRSGNITGKSVFFKIIREGDFEFLERELRDDIHLFEVLEDITLRLPMETVTTIDPGLTYDTTSIEVTEQIFLGLTDLDPETYEAVPELATGWTASEDGMTYRFSLRPDVTWTDGVPVTAHDIVWAVRRNISPETQSPSAFMLNILKNAGPVAKGEKDPSEIGVYAADDFTVVFELEHPAAYFPAMAGLWVYRPLPRHVIGIFKDQWTLPGNIQTNGSYKLAAWEKGVVMILRKNPAYYDADHVSIPEVRYYIIPESSVGLAMYKSNQLDIIGDAYLRIPIAVIPNLVHSPALSAEYSREPLFCSYAYAFNTRMAPVDNPLVRKAISAAIDRRLLIKMVTRGNQEVAYTFTRPPIFGSVDPGQGVGIHFDPAAAKKWLAQAGYPGGKGFPEISLLYNESETHEKVARAVQTFLKHYLNIDVRLEPMEFSEYLRARTEELPGHMIRFGWCSDYPDANNWLNDLFHPTLSDNIIGWDSPEFAELMDNARKAREPDLRKKLYKRAEDILCEELCAVVPVYYETAHYLVKPRVKGWYNMAMGGQHIRNWYLEE